MNYELLVTVGAVGAIVVLAFLYARAAGKAALVDQFESANTDLASTLAAQRQVTATKEEYIRDLEKTVLGAMPASQLATRLTLLFAANRSRTAGTVPASKSGPK